MDRVPAPPRAAELDVATAAVAEVRHVALLAAVVVVAFAYAEGGQQAQDLGSWQVIAWAIMISTPVPLILDASVAISRPALLVNGLLYFDPWNPVVDFVAWYSGMTMGGVGRVSQI